MRDPFRFASQSSQFRSTSVFDMKSSLLGMNMPVRRWTRIARRLAVLGGFIVAAATGWAQSLAFQTLAGTPGVTTPFNNSAPVTFNNPYGVAVDSQGNVYVADTSNHVIRRITSAGVVSTLAGAQGTSGSADDTGGGTLARFNAPQGVALNGTGDRVYVADTGNHTVRVISLSTIGGSVTAIGTLAGSPGTSGTTDANGANARFTTPRGIAADSAGNLYVADTGNHLIRRVVIATGAVSRIAGLAGTVGAVNGNDTVATFNSPYGVAVSNDNGTVYVADFNNHLIRAVTVPTVSVSTFAGVAGSSGFIDAANLSARFFLPTGVAVDAAGSVFVADFGNNAIRQIASGSVSTPAGPAATGGATAGAAGFANGTGNAVRFTGPIGIAAKTVATVPYLYVADTNNHVIRQGAAVIAPTVTNPAPVTASVGATGVTFAATVTSGWPAPTLQWQIKPAGTGSWQNLIASSTYQNVNTATLTINGVTASMNGDVFRLMTSPAPAVEPTGAALTVSQSPSFASPSISLVGVVGRSSSFIIAASGSPTITYGPVGAIGTTGLTLNANGTITGTPSSTETAILSVTATNSVGSASQLVTINVVPEASAAAPVITSATSATFATGQSNNFTFTASGAPTPTLGLSGTLPAGVTFLNGLLSGTPFSAEGSPFALTVTASNALGTTTQSFTLSVTAATIAPSITTQPVNVVANLGANASFTAAATGSPSPTLRWQRQASGSSGGFADLFNDATFNGTDTATLTITGVQAGMTGDQFRLMATNASGSVASSIVTLTVNVGTTISTFAGQAGLTGATDGAATAARFNTPASIAIDTLGNYYIADTANHVIRKINSAGVVSTFAGSPGASGNVDGAGAEARFSGPSAIAVNAVGTVFVADTFNQTIRSITPNGVVSTLAGQSGVSGSADGVGSAARFSFPAGIATDVGGTLYVSDSSNHTIRRIQGNTVSTLAGSAGVAGSADGNGNAARFNYPAHLAVEASGVIYVADSQNHTIRRISPSGGVTTVAGTAGVVGASDANGTAATFNRPTGVAVDSSGNIYVADTNNNTIRRVSALGAVTTIAGAVGQAGSSDGAGAQARFNQPFAVAVDVNGNLFIADTRNHTIRRSGTTSAPGIISQPQNQVVPIGGTATFTVVANGTPTPSFQWQRQPAGSSGFINLSNGSGFGGVNTNTLTVTGILDSHNGDQYRVLVTNGVNPPATSEAVTLTIGESPTITSAAAATVRATDALNFTFTASGTPASAFTATGLPSWASLSTSGQLTGTPPVGSEGTYAITVTANNGATATQAFTLTVTPAIVAPTITTQPALVSVNQGQSATFTVSATGTAPLNYQWRRNGASIIGATGASYTVGNAQSSTAGTYSVTITNTGGSIVSSGAQLIVNTPPLFTSQPRSQTALAGSTVTFSATATGASSFNYQWRRDGVAIEGATGSTLTLTGVTAASSGLYDVQVSNGLGTVISSIAQLTVTSTPSAPVITAQPASRTVVVGGATTLSIGASGAPAPSYQWRKNGANIPGATGPTYAFSSAQSSDGASYDVVVTNSAGSVTSAIATLRVIARSYAGIYLGTFMGAGDFGLYVRDDNTAVLIGYLGNDARVPIVGLNVTIDDSGQFSFVQSTPAVAVSGVISANGSVIGAVSGAANAPLTASRAAETGASQSYTGYYQAGATGSGTTVYAIVGAAGQGQVVARSGTSSNGGPAAVSSTGQVTLANAFGTVSLNIDASTGIASGSVTIGSATAQVSGGSDAALLQQRLVNISSRARVGTGDSVAIAGFVISGEESKAVLIRAVGPTLGATFNIPGALASPRLELFRVSGGANTSIAVNTGISGNRTVIDLASARAGAFALGSAGNDAALLVTLAPGNYTASVSSTTNTAGVALIEVYDLTAPAVGQKMLNISTRASAGAAENTLIAGFVVPPGSAKRVLVRGIGPGLAQFGVGGVLTQPILTLINNATHATIATNTNWNTSADAAALAPASSQVGGFPLANNDSALIAMLPPGDYSAQVVGVGGATGVALIEVYELP